MSEAKCPFSIGEEVEYRPTPRGRGLVVMTGFSGLKPGVAYKIARIEKDLYVVPEGFEKASGGGAVLDRIRSTEN